MIWLPSTSILVMDWPHSTQLYNVPKTDVAMSQLDPANGFYQLDSSVSQPTSTCGLPIAHCPLTMSVYYQSVQCKWLFTWDMTTQAVASATPDSMAELCSLPI